MAICTLVRKCQHFLQILYWALHLLDGWQGVCLPSDSRVHANPARTRCCRKTSSMLEVDDEGGRMFLRVLIHLTMHDYAPLVSGALQLLFKHFSQRQEAMHTFKQVLPLSQQPHPQGVGRETRGPPGPGTEQAGCLGHALACAGHWQDGGGAHSSKGSLRCTIGVLCLAEFLKGEGHILATFISSPAWLKACHFLRCGKHFTVCKLYCMRLC